MSSTSQPHQPDPSYPSSKPPRPPIPSPTSYLSYPVAHVVSGIYRRLTEPSVPTISTNPPPQASPNTMPGIYTPPNRTASPFQPPPLTPLTLRGIHESTTSSAQILTRALAEEIRLLVPPRLQLVDDWSLIYSVEQDGVSLATLYAKCDVHRGKRSGYVLVVRDGTSTPDRIRFKAFPYSGVNDYVLYCEPSYLSVGGGDGRYGLWLDGVLERGVSGPCLTFGNEGLSEEGGKFEVLGVEIWCIGV
ncbi:TLDc domain [Lasallia pustulata]|uniref:Oxidation resistance protein 1 n=1 Tax=Lasallia pustulata TaxID=136370 RepID=A0A1W5D1V2_9LECA|nr:TLDc domain [Lasallia pustulata]